MTHRYSPVYGGAVFFMAGRASVVLENGKADFVVNCCLNLCFSKARSKKTLVHF